MDYPVILIALAAALAGALAVLAWRGRAGDAARLAEAVKGIADLQKLLADRQQQSETRVNERLDAMSKLLGESLSQQTEKTGATLKGLHERLAVIDAAQKRLTDLSSQVVGLQDILSNKQARGAFGQTRLEDIVTDALPGGAFAFEATLANGRRVDCLVNLPRPPGPIAIDSKFPLEAYRALVEAKDESSRRQAERAFTQDVLKHVADIAERYIVPGETADWALMFVPSEAVYGEAHAHFPRIVEEARKRRVAIVSPNTMMALLSTVRAVMRDAEMRKQADRIQVEVERMLNDVRLLDERAAALRKHFDLADRDVEEISKSTRRIVRSGEKVREVRLEDEAEGGAGLPLEPPAGSA